MDFAIPDDIQDTLDALDAFIEKEIKPLQAQDDNERFFDHRREWARTDFENDGVPRADWEALLREMRRRDMRWFLDMWHRCHGSVLLTRMQDAWCRLRNQASILSSVLQYRNHASSAQWESCPQCLIRFANRCEGRDLLQRDVRG